MQKAGALIKAATGMDRVEVTEAEIPTQQENTDKKPVHVFEIPADVVKRLADPKEIEKRQTQRKTLEAKEKLSAARAKLTQMGFTKDMHSRTFKSFVAGSDSQKAALSEIKAYCRQFPKKHNIWLFGESGIGKSHLAQAACGGILFSVPEARILFLTDGAFSRECFRSEWVESLLHYDLVVVDEISFLLYHNNPMVRERFTGFLWDVALTGHPKLLATCNYSYEELIETDRTTSSDSVKIDKTLANRLYHLFVPIKMDGENGWIKYRRT